MVALSLIINKDCLSKFAKIHMCVGRDAGGDKIYLNEKKNCPNVVNIQDVASLLQG